MLYPELHLLEALAMLPKLRLETIVNLVVLLTCGVLVGGTVQRWYAPAAAGAAPAPNAIATGDAVPSAVVAGLTGKPSLVLLLSSTCRFCTESMPLYRELRSQLQDRIALVAAGREAPETLTKYIEEHQVSVDAVRKVDGPWMAQPTPTMVLVDAAGKVAKIWVGYQPDGTADGVGNDIRAALN
jgi:peroxiredoxin